MKTMFIVMWINGVYMGAAPLTSTPRGECERLAAILTMRAFGETPTPRPTYTCETGLVERTHGERSGR